MSWLIISALVIVLILGGVAAYYLLQVRVLEQKRAQQQEVIEKEVAEKRQHANVSIQVIAGSLLSEQMSLTEGAIRIRAMLDNLEVEEVVREEFTAFYQLSDATAHIPILGAWKKLDKKQKRAFDNEREALEKTHKEFVEDAAKRIQGRQF